MDASGHPNDTLTLFYRARCIGLVGSFLLGPDFAAVVDGCRFRIPPYLWPSGLSSAKVQELTLCRTQSVSTGNCFLVSCSARPAEAGTSTERLIWATGPFFAFACLGKRSKRPQKWALNGLAPPGVAKGRGRMVAAADAARLQSIRARLGAKPPVWKMKVQKTSHENRYDPLQIAPVRPNRQWPKKAGSPLQDLLDRLAFDR